MLEKSKKNEAAGLNEYDRKILDKYTKYYTNFIESNTAKNEVLKDERYKGKD